MSTTPPQRDATFSVATPSEMSVELGSPRRGGGDDNTAGPSPGAGGLQQSPSGLQATRRCESPTTAQHDILELVDGAEVPSDGGPAGGSTSKDPPTSRTRPMQSPRAAPNVVVGSASPAAPTSLSVLPVPRSPSACSSLSDDFMNYNAALGVSGVPRPDAGSDASQAGSPGAIAVRRRRRSTLVGALSPDSSPMSPVRDTSSREGGAAKSHRRRAMVPVPCAFAAGAAALLLVALAAVVFSALASEAFADEDDLEGARSRAASLATTANIQLRLLQSITSTGAALLSFNVNASLAAAGVSSSMLAAQPNIRGVAVLNASAMDYLLETIHTGFCAVNGDGDPALCPSIFGFNYVFLDSLDNPADPRTAQAVYRISMVAAQYPHPDRPYARLLNYLETDSQGFNSTRYPGGAPTFGRATTSATLVTQDLRVRNVNAMTVNSQAVPVTAPLPLDPRRHTMDPINYSPSGALIGRNISNDAMYDILRSPATSFTQGAAAVSDAVLHVNLTSGAVRQVHFVRGQHVDGSAFAIGLSMSHSAQGLLSAFTVRQFAQVCLVAADPLHSDSTILACRSSGEDLELEYEVMPNDARELTPRLAELLEWARARRAESQNRSDAFAWPYRRRRVVIGRSVHVVGLGYLTSATLSGHIDPVTGVPDGVQHTGELWVLTIQLKPATVDLSRNTSLNVGLIVFAIIFLFLVVFLVMFYWAFVRPIRDIRHRMRLVAGLDFSTVPDDTIGGSQDTPGQSFEAGSDASPNANNSMLTPEEAEAAAEARREEIERNEALRPTTMLREVDDLYSDFFHVAGALRKVVPFLPTLLQPRPSSGSSSSDDGTTAVAMVPSPGAASSQQGSQQANPLSPGAAVGGQGSKQSSVGLVSFKTRRSTDVSQTAPGDRSSGGDDDDESDSGAASHLSSISEIDLSDLHGHGRRGHAVHRVGGSSSHLSDGSSGKRTNTTAPAAGATPESRPLGESHSFALGSTTNQDLAAVSASASASRSAKPSPQAPPSVPPHSVEMPPMLSRANTTALLKGADQSPHGDSWDRGKNRYANETQNASVVVAYFQLYLRKSARADSSIASAVQREFIASAVGIATSRKGQVAALTPRSMVALWKSTQPEVKASAAALQFTSHIKAWLRGRSLTEACRVSVGLAHGPATVGILGTSTKKFFVCDGPTVSRAAIVASCGIHNHAAVAVTTPVQEQLKMFAALRAIEQISFPRALRKGGRSDISETIFQCLSLDQQEDDLEWMYRLEQKGALAGSVSMVAHQQQQNNPHANVFFWSSEDAVAATPGIVRAPNWLSHVAAPDPSDTSEMAHFTRGYVAWCTGRLAVALAEFQKALAAVRKAGFEDQYVSMKVELLQELKGNINDFEDRYGVNAPAIHTAMAASLSGPGLSRNTPRHGSSMDTLSTLVTPTAVTASAEDRPSFQLAHSSSTLTVNDHGSLRRRTSFRPNLTGATHASHDSSDGTPSAAALAANAPVRCRRLVELFDPVLRGAPYARLAALLGVETFAFEL